MLPRIVLKSVWLLSLVSLVLSVSETSWLGPELKVLKRVYNDCRPTDDFLGCLKQKALIVVSRAMNKDVIRVMDGITFEKQNSTFEESNLDPEELRELNDLPRLDRTLLQKVDKFMKTHFLIVDMTESRGKDKDKKIYKFILAAALTAMGIMGPIGIKALALLAGKALLVSKIALTVAGIVALKKIFTPEKQEETNFQIHAEDHNRRNAFLVKPMKKNAQTNDPYRYYYEYPTQ